MKRLQILSALVFFCTLALHVSAAGPDYAYSGVLDIDAETGHIQSNWTISVYDPANSDITFLLRDTLENIKTSGPDLESVGVEKLSDFGDLWTIKIRLAKSDTIERTFHISYSGVLLPEPMENRINAIEPGRVELNVDSFWFPIDRRFSKVLTADLEISIGQGWTGVTTGEALPLENGVRILSTDPRMDIAFSLSKTFYVTQADGFTILEGLIGKPAFLDFTRAWFNSAEKTTPGLLQVLESVAGKEHSAELQSMLGE